MLGAIAGRVDMPAEMQARLRRFLSEQPSPRLTLAHDLRTGRAGPSR